LFVPSGNHSRSGSNSPRKAESPLIFSRVVRFECITGIKNGTARDVILRFRKQPF
jgi:hypothetical protein